MSLSQLQSSLIEKTEDIEHKKKVIGLLNLKLKVSREKDEQTNIDLEALCIIPIFIYIKQISRMMKFELKTIICIYK